MTRSRPHYLLWIACTIAAGLFLRWIDRLREIPIGRLLLGSVFHWPDFIAYTAGIALGVTFEWLRLKNHTPLDRGRLALGKKECLTHEGGTPSVQ